MRDWGMEQKWMSILLPLLLLYNGRCPFVFRSFPPLKLEAGRRPRAALAAEEPLEEQVAAPAGRELCGPGTQWMPGGSHQ